MWFLYVIKSKNFPFIYVGITQDVERRLKEHNDGKSLSTKAYKPYTLETYIAVQTSYKARKLEKYFKSGSGKTILKKRILDDEDIAEHEVRGNA